MAKYSFSKIQLYQQCPLKFRYKYIDKLELTDFEETADLLLWKTVHSSLEKLYNDINNLKIPTEDQVIDYFNILRNTRISELESKNKKLVVKWKNELEDYIRRWKEYLKIYYQRFYPFQDIKVIWTEIMLNFEIEKWITFQWFIDRLDKSGQEFIINDYKTNKVLPPEDKENYVEQLTLYGFWIKQKYGKYLNKIKARLCFLHFDIIDEREVTDENLNRVVEKYKNIIHEIEKLKSEFENDKKVFKPCENNFCKFCEYQSICPLFSHADMQDESVDWISEKTIKSLVDDYSKISKEYNKIEKEKDYLKDLFTKYIEWKDIKRLYWFESNVTINEIVNYKILEKEEFIQKVKELWMLRDVLEIDRFKVNKLIKDGKIDKKSLKDIVQENISYVFKSKVNKAGT